MAAAYSWDFKAEVLAVYEVDGPAAAERAYGVCRRTVIRWAKACGVVADDTLKSATEAATNSLRARRERIREKLAIHAEKMLDRLDDSWTFVTKDGAVVELEKPPASVCKDLATTAAILIDKFRLEAGEATERSEVTVTDEDRREVERDVARVIAEAEAAARDAAG